MSQHRATEGNADHPRTAAEEVLKEFEEAETDVRPDARPDEDGEAADALTPSRSAQEDARRRAGDHGDESRGDV
ncbi:hypothetical protein GCM10022244_04080 [Streptomyces gulbargensis]|uniref:Uncharacterized protein n=1 Tax=Streptomyces gulbargensis TaxID=364901 RepID=A0ABP7LAQ2_9ACTN